MFTMKLITCLSPVFWFILSPVYGQEAAMEKARALAGEERYAEAITLLERVPEDSMTAGGWYRLGTYYQAQYQHERALETLQRADTTDVRVLAATGRSLNLLDRRREAVTYYGAAFALDSTRSNVAVSLAEVHADLGQWEEVRDIYKDLAGRDENNAFVQAQLGRAYAMLDSTDSAIVHLERARRLNPKGLSVVLRLSAVYLNNDYVASARRVVDAALLVMPEEPLLWQRAGDAAMKEEDYAGAVVAYWNTLTLGDTTVVNLRNLGLALYLTQSYDQAVGFFEDAYAADSTDELNTFYLGMAHLRLEQYEEALTYLEQAHALMGTATIADIYTQKGVALKELHRPGEAVAAFELALQLDPEGVDAHYYLARLYDTRGDLPAATRHYSEFLENVSEDEMREHQDLARRRMEAISKEDSLGLRASAGDDTLTTDTTQARE